ncbi:MAG: hypothetical protein IT473_09935 [Lysobacter sp.]|nr:hypothetical protein [Lysobacter sp.]
MIKHASWVHGNAVVTELPSGLYVQHWGWGTELAFTYRLGQSPAKAWCHIPIPTPVIVDNVRLKAQTFFLMFKTGQHAAIDNIHVFDGPHKVHGWDVIEGSNYAARRTGDHSRGLDSSNVFVLPEPHEVMFGLSLAFAIAPVSVNTSLPLKDPEGSVLITGAGADLF